MSNPCLATHFLVDNFVVACYFELFRAFVLVVVCLMPVASFLHHVHVEMHMSNADNMIKLFDTPNLSGLHIDTLS